MVRSLLTAALLAIADGSCLGNLAPFVFRDMHDGDLKVVTAHVFDFMIQPYDKTSEDWTVYGTFDYDCVATVDFNVPGKPNPPPNNLTMQLWVMGSHDDTLTRLGLEFTDPTAANPTEPVNLWVLDKWPKVDTTVVYTVGTAVEAARSRLGSTGWCIDKRNTLVLGDMHDGDKKALKVSGTQRKQHLQISPSGTGESWTVETDFDDDTDCLASVDFNVPGKPNPPPVPLNARIWKMISVRQIQEPDKTALLFQDPSGTLDEEGAVLNTWVQGNAGQAEVV